MFDTTWVAELGADQACAMVTATQGRLRESEWRELVLAGHWATLHDGETVTGRARAGAGAGQAGAAGAGGAAGGERVVRPGGEGTPEVAEFACAELGLVMGCGFIAASSLIRDALDLQHRHPLMWQALGEGRARVWKARQVARLVHAAGLTREQAWFVERPPHRVSTRCRGRRSPGWSRPGSSRPTRTPPRSGAGARTWPGSSPPAGPTSTAC